LSNSNRKKLDQQTTTQIVHEQNLLLSSEDENSCHSSDDENVPVKTYSIVSKAKQSKKKQGKAVKNQTINGDIDHSKVKHLNDLPAEALSIVQTIKSIKAIVKYVKKVSNPIFQSHMCAFFYL
jgi:hypothetical protein